MNKRIGAVDNVQLGYVQSYHITNAWADREGRGGSDPLNLDPLSPIASRGRRFIRPSVKYFDY